MAPGRAGSVIRATLGAAHRRRSGPGGRGQGSRNSFPATSRRSTTEQARRGAPARASLL